MCRNQQCLLKKLRTMVYWRDREVVKGEAIVIYELEYFGICNQQRLRNFLQTSDFDVTFALGVRATAEP